MPKDICAASSTPQLVATDPMNLSLNQFEKLIMKDSVPDFSTILVLLIAFFSIIAPACTFECCHEHAHSCHSHVRSSPDAETAHSHVQEDPCRCGCRNIEASLVGLIPTTVNHSELSTSTSDVQYFSVRLPATNRRLIAQLRAGPTSAGSHSAHVLHCCFQIYVVVTISYFRITKDNSSRA